ncbi:MAG: DNA recombination protein RmuC [Pseudomonadota bacterium]
MTIDILFGATVSAILGWGLCLVLLIWLFRRGARLQAQAAQLTDAREATIAQAAKLEQFDSIRDDLAFERKRATTLEHEKTTLTTRLEERERHVAELGKKLEGEFRSMSSTLVRETGDALLRQANQTFEKQQLIARQDAQVYSRSVSDLLKPMRDTLTRYEEGLRDMRDHQKRAQGELTGQISTLAQSASAVQAEAQSLASALKAGSGARGQWGETTLRNVVEMAGMSPYCDFKEQYSVTDEDSKSRKQPDLVVNLPGERLVAVDSKVSLSDWLDAAAALDDETRGLAVERHGKSVWGHVQSLAAKDYAGALKKEGAIDFVVMFMPGESFFTTAIDARPTLFEDAYKKGVLIATPTTLIAILKSVAHTWRQQKMGEHAVAVAGMASDLYDSLRKTGVYLAEVGKSLERTVNAYNGLVGNMEGRVLPRARRFAEYEMPGTEKPLPAVSDAETDVRHPSEDKDLLLPSASPEISPHASMVAE